MLEIVPVQSHPPVVPTQEIQPHKCSRSWIWEREHGGLSKITEWAQCSTCGAVSKPQPNQKDNSQ